MMYPSPWENEIVVLRHHYYHRKPAFERDADRYEEWAAFAVEEGAFVYRIGGAEGEAAAGQMVVCPPGLDFRRHTGRPISFHYFLFHWLDGQGRPIAERFDRPLCMNFASSDRWLSGLSTLRSPAFAGHPTYRLWRNHVLLDLFRLFAMEQSLMPVPDGPKPSDPLMEEARSILGNICEDPVSISEVARRFSLSSVQFSRRFRKAFGMLPSRYIEKARLDKVCHLLANTGMTIEQIAHSCGLSNGFYLSRYFSSKMNMSPSAYRNQYRV